MENDDIFIIAIVVVWIILYFILSKKNRQLNITKTNTTVNKIKQNSPPNKMGQPVKQSDKNNKIINNKKIDRLNTNKSILHSFKIISNKYKDNIALKVYRDTNWIEVTYKQYYQNCLRFATSLEKNCGKGNVGIIGFNSPAWFYSYLGTLLCHSIPVGIYNTSSPEIIEHIIDECKIKVVVLEDSVQLDKFKLISNKDLKLIIMYATPTEEQLKLGEKMGIQIVSFVEMMNNVGKVELKDFKPNLEQNETKVATIIYTSGTTNMYPKGVEITYGNIINSLSSTVNEINQSQLDVKMGEERFVSYLPLNHIAAQLMDIYMPIVTAGCVWFANKSALKTGSSLIDTLTSAKPTIFIGIPRVWEKIVEGIESNLNYGILSPLVKTITPCNLILKKIGLNKSKLNITSTAPMSENARDKLLKYGINLYDAYGMSETTGLVSISLPGQQKPGSVGKVMCGLKLKLAPDDEILIKGDSIFEKYRNQPEETLKAFDRDGWFCTGDLGKLDANGFLYIVGRKKEIIIGSGGENIAPVPIEEKLKDNLDCAEHVVVIGNKRKFLSVLIVLKKDTLTKYIKTKKMRNKINKQIDIALERTNRTCPNNASKIQKYVVLNNTFTINKEITGTLKLRRSYIETTYKKIIDKLYT